MSYTKEKAKEYYKEYWKKHPEKIKKASPFAQMKSHLKVAYGITHQDYENMFHEQDGKCFICGKHQNQLKRKLHVDHDHTTGKVRKLLCQNCNSVVGQSFENIEILEKTIQYLRDF
jgi:hypothetical protein